jgi:threonine/homoserine/homoserine lactone efflux protein
MFGLMVYAYGADALARRFQSPVFARWFFRIAAATMAGSALFAVFATWSVNGS